MRPECTATKGLAGSMRAVTGSALGSGLLPRHFSVECLGNQVFCWCERPRCFSRRVAARAFSPGHEDRVFA